MGVVVGTPIGILAGTYLAEYGRYSRLTSVVRFVNDILLSAPSIVIGLFVYEITGRARRPFLGLGRRHRARHPGHPGGRPHHRGHAAAGARTRCAKPPPRLGSPRWKIIAESPIAPRAPASSPACFWPSRASPARPRRCSSPRSTTSSGASTSTRRWPACRSPSSSSRCRPTTTGSSSPGPAP